MNTFKRKSLYAALAGVGALGLAGTANAVFVNADGLGQVLIYPYYTVRADSNGNTYSTLLSVVNTTNSTKAVKVRVNEGKNSREVIDFNLFLSPYDVWTAAILPSTATGGGKLVTNDKSCTIPPIPAGGVDFVNFAYISSNTNGGDSADQTLDRTKEGYVEIIEMATFPKGSDTDVGATHVNGVPPCTVDDTTAGREGVAPSGGLFGGASLVNVASGTDTTEDAVALDAFYVALFNESIYQPSGYIFPDLSFVNPKVSTVFNGAQGVVQTNWATSINGVDPVSAVLMHDNIYNEFISDASIKGATDWVITMPTKRYYVAPGSGNAVRPFQRNFGSGNAGACDDVGLALFDREEFKNVSVSFSPPPPTVTNAICWEANVITFNNGNVLGSKNSLNINTSFTAGWMRLSFPVPTGNPNAHKMGAPAGQTIVSPLNNPPFATTVTYYGLPTIGFMVESFSNNFLPGPSGAQVLSNYGGNFVHKQSRLIQ
jgi:hypothetical protein